MERVILHSDLNNFYASVECRRNPALRGKPVAVAGDPKARHGIVLAKNELAKACGVATGNPLWMARQKCPGILFVPPHYDLYMEISQRVRDIYAQYTDQVEPYGLDECWLDVTASQALFGSGKTIADTLRERIRSELGITASVGVSFNKIFAKLGSDMKKPDATTVIPPAQFRRQVWPLPVGDLLYVGRATHQRLRRYGIHTIGQLAAADPAFLQQVFGKNGRMLWRFANGMDTSPVSNIGAKSLIKSIGNSATAPRDLVTGEEIRILLYVLCESVSARLREYDFICNTVQLGVRDCDLNSYECQGKLEYPNRTCKSLFETAYRLYRQHHLSGRPVRSLSVRACNLSILEYEQLSLMPDIRAIQKQEELETAVDSIRSRFGHDAVRRGILLTDRRLSALNPKEDHIVHPERFFRPDPFGE